MTVDALSAIQNSIAAISSAAAAVPDEISAAVASGDFSQVLAEIQQSLGVVAPAAPLSTSTGVTGGLTNLMSSIQGPSGLPTPSGTTIAATAEQYLGVPYVWGGSSPQGFDCSGLVQYVYGQFGINLPRTTVDQANAGTAIPDISQALPGDLVFFPGADGTPTAPGHVGIYLGNGQMIAAPETGENVRIQPVGDPVAIRRIVPASPAPSPNPTGSTNSSIPADLQPLFLAATTQYGLPAGLLPAVASVESNFQNNVTSTAGAEGIMQIMPSTAAGLGIDPTDPAQAIDGAARLLSGYLNQYGSIPLAVAAYNAGPNAVAQNGGIPPYPETQSYVQDVMSQMGAMQ